MQYYGNNDWRDYHLAHYGVKGMKWHKHLKATTEWWKNTGNTIGSGFNSAGRAAGAGKAIGSKVSSLAGSIGKKKKKESSWEKVYKESKRASTKHKLKSDAKRAFNRLVSGTSSLTSRFGKKKRMKSIYSHNSYLGSGRSGR